MVYMQFHYVCTWAFYIYFYLKVWTICGDETKQQTKIIIIVSHEKILGRFKKL